MKFITTEIKPRTAHHGKSHHGPRAPAKFVAIDGEGVTLPDGTHKYVLVRIGTNPALENPNGLHWRSIFHYLYSYFEPGTSYVGFYLGYDFTQFFRTMREDRAAKLLTKAGIAGRKIVRLNRGGMTFPVESDGWQFDILSGRRLRIRPKDCDCTVSMCRCEVPKHPWMYICDAGGFFQTSFLVAINPAKWPEPILTQDEFDTIQRGKDARSEAKLDDDMRMYNELENDVMARLMERVDEGLSNLGVYLSPKQWFSPAQAAQAWMTNRVPTRETIEKHVPQYARDAARAGFFGGWFEIMCHGRIPGIVYQYDINSAYPAHAHKLPCLLHGTWSRGKKEPKNPGPYCMVRCDVTVPKGGNHAKKYIGSMPHRNKQGKISRPLFTSGWYWLHELRAAERADCTRVLKWHEWIKYDPCDCPSPLAELKELYLERLRQGKNTPMGRAARLVYNCVYGKLAQNVGNPKFMNFIWASLITAGCRVQILDAIASHPKGKSDVVQIATDAVYFLSPHPGLPISEELGDWDTTEHHHMTLFKPGVYWDDMAREMIAANKAPQFKARGVSARDIAHRLADIDRQFDELDKRKLPKMLSPLGNVSNKTGWPTISFKPSFAMVTALQALMRHNWSLAGTIMDAEATQSSNPGLKREGAYWDEKAGLIRSEPIRNNPQPGQAITPSEPYSDDYGQANPDNPMSDESREMFGINQDGAIDQLMIDALMPERKWTEDQNNAQREKAKQERPYYRAFSSGRRTIQTQESHSPARRNCHKSVSPDGARN